MTGRNLRIHRMSLTILITVFSSGGSVRGFHFPFSSDFMRYFCNRFVKPKPTKEGERGFRFTQVIQRVCNTWGSYSKIEYALGLDAILIKI